MTSENPRRDRADLAIDALAALIEPTRRRVYEHLRATGAPATRDEVAGALELGRPLAAFHLDALAKAGLVDVDYARPPGRRGPGAGRPAKRYRATAGEVAASVPARRYDLAGRILAAGVRDASRSGGATDARSATFNAAEMTGRELGQERVNTVAGTGGASSGPLGHVCAVLAELGYEPVSDDETGDAGSLRLRNCPFHAVVEVEPELVCQLNVHLLHGLLEGMSLHDLAAEFKPTPGECCVRITARDAGLA